MVFTAIYRSAVTRLLAALIVALVVSPYSEPFATIHGTDFGGAGAVDISVTAKDKAPVQDALVPAPAVGVLMDVVAIADHPFTPSLARDSRHAQRAVLRL